MENHVYKTLEITGSSHNSIEEAVQTAISYAGNTMHGMRWFEVSDIRGHIEGGEINHWQVTVKLGLTLDPADAK